MAGAERFSPWQSFADLAMGLMAVFAITLVVLLLHQSHDLEKLEKEHAELERESEQLLREREQFALMFLTILEQSERIVVSQDEAESWLRTSFEEGDCRLRVNPDGKMEVIPSGDLQLAADLYDSGETGLNRAGQDALASCRDNFIKLANALAPRGGDFVTEERALPCVTGFRRREAEMKDAANGQAIESLRRGLEALVLEGNTDRASLRGRLDGRSIPPIVAERGGRLLTQSSATSFVENALLGSERARQALGHLLGLVEACDAAPDDALEVLMSRVRVESPSFGRYLAGPVDARLPGCGEGPGCDLARNLSLRIRWRKEELRRPAHELQRRFCETLRDGESSLAKGLRDQGKDVAALLLAHCQQREAG